MTTLQEMIDSLPDERRRRVEERANILIAEEMSLRQLRKAREKTQAQVAEYLGIDQANVSRIEQRTDLLLSTLSNYVEASGGRLRLVAEFPNSPPITLSGIGNLNHEDDTKSS